MMGILILALNVLKVNWGLIEMSKLVWGAGFNDKTRPVSVDGKRLKNTVCGKIC